MSKKGKTITPIRLSNRTLEIFKNFSQFDVRLHIRPNEPLITEQYQGTYAVTGVEEDFPVEFIIYDLNKFLSIIAMFKNDCDLLFAPDGTYVEIVSGKEKVRFVGSTDVPDLSSLADMDFDEKDSISMQITKEQMGNLEKTLGILGHDEIFFRGSGTNVIMGVGDIQQESYNTFTSECDGVVNEHNADFNVALRAGAFKFIPGKYDITITSDLMIKFAWSEPDSDLVYYVGLLFKSQYESDLTRSDNT